MSSDMKPKAIIFVDYEHWYYSMTKTFHLRPNLRAWRNKLAEKYVIMDIYFFADFSKENMANELQRLREVSNTIIETRSTSEYLKKDYTDFIILDTIYQKAITATDIKDFIIFTGDGHFTSVVAFLRNQCGKNVGIYGIKRSCSKQLKDIASWWVELPDDTEVLMEACRAILENFRYIDYQRETRGRVIRPTFWKTVERVSEHYEYDKEIVTDAMHYLLEHEYLYQVDERVSFNSNIKVLRMDWEKVHSENANDRFAEGLR